METKLLPTLAIVHSDSLKKSVLKETLVIIGSPRGGTSIVAYALRRAGYFLGNHVSALNHEDQEIAAAFENEENARLRSIIAARNEQHERWGFKFPKAVMKLEWLAANLRNPVFVVIYRNPLAIARSILSRGVRQKQDEKHLRHALELGLDRMMIGTTAVFQSSAPAILIDVDLAQLRPAVFLREFLRQLSIECSNDLIMQIAHEIRRPGYKTVESRGPVEHLENLAGS